jgi:hypothetical protein
MRKRVNRSPPARIEVPLHSLAPPGGRAYSADVSFLPTLDGR